MPRPHPRADPPPLRPSLTCWQREKAFATGPPITLDAPLAPPFRSDELHVCRTSNVLNIEPRPFDPDAFRAEEGPGFDAGQGALLHGGRAETTGRAGRGVCVWGGGGGGEVLCPEQGCAGGGVASFQTQPIRI